MKFIITITLLLSSLLCYPQVKDVLDLTSLKNLSLTELQNKLKEKKFKFGELSKFDKLKEINAEIEIWNHFDVNNNQTSVSIIRASGEPVIIAFVTWDTAFFRTTPKAVSELKLNVFKKINQKNKLLEQYYNDTVYLMIMNTYMEGNWYFMYYIVSPDKEKYLMKIF